MKAEVKSTPRQRRRIVDPTWPRNASRSNPARAAVSFNDLYSGMTSKALAKIRGEHVGEFLSILILLLFRARHDSELHAARLLGQDVTFLRRFVELVQNIGSDCTRERCVGLQSFEDFRSGHGRLVLPPSVVVRGSRDQGVTTSKVRIMARNVQGFKELTQALPHGLILLQEVHSC